jgi:hypothetical protein
MIHAVLFYIQVSVGPCVYVSITEVGFDCYYPIFGVGMI